MTDNEESRKCVRLLLVAMYDDNSSQTYDFKDPAEVELSSVGKSKKRDRKYQEPGPKDYYLPDPDDIVNTYTIKVTLANDKNFPSLIVSTYPIPGKDYDERSRS